MPTFRATVTSAGDVRLPDELRDRLGIAAGSEVEFFLTIDGQVHFHAITRRACDIGAFLPEIRKPPISVREYDDAIAEELSEKHRRFLAETARPAKSAAE